MSVGKQALARLLDQLRQTADADNVDTLVERIWPDFVAAVGSAQWEISDAELKGINRWREERHKGEQ